MLASPIFFYAVSAHTKIFMDRCQSFWVRQHASEEKDEVRASGVERRREMQAAGTRRKGLFIAVGATRGKRLFEGALLTVRYFFEAIDTERWKSLLYRGIDEEGAILEHPEHLRETYETGRDLVRAIEPTR
jgi:multimeric flavodoxin WrbA